MHLGRRSRASTAETGRVASIAKESTRRKVKIPDGLTSPWSVAEEADAHAKCLVRDRG